MTRFAGKVAIITGSGTGIGFAIALKLGKEGARIMIVDHDKKLAQDASAKLNSFGIESLLQVGDVGDYSTAKEAGETAVNEWGQIDILVNNAGIAGGVGSIWELPVEEMDKVYRTNLRGVYLFCNQIIPYMLNRNYGRIVNVASIAGKEGNPRMVPYSASKAAVIGLTKSVGKELATTGITINCITPAVIRTRMVENLTPKQVEYMVERIPMGRTGDPEEIASLVTWLSSEECSFSTGAVFDISGGRATY
tara:strand:+ start:9588 stop:10337 length:750 start_codon:yes stop_codon:yes gene_type:complete